MGNSFISRQPLQLSNIQPFATAHCGAFAPQNPPFFSIHLAPRWRQTSSTPGVSMMEKRMWGAYS